MTDFRPPFAIADERPTLVAFLDYLRDAVVRKLDGVDEEAARRPLVASGTSLLWLVTHLTMVEVAWFQWVFAGRDVRIPSGDVQEETVDAVVEAYRRACAASNEVVAGAADLDRLAARPGTAPEPMSLRWILVHMVEETGRHAGHADILRELLDGSVGR